MHLMKHNQSGDEDLVMSEPIDVDSSSSDVQFRRTVNPKKLPTFKFDSGSEVDVAAKG